MVDHHYFLVKLDKDNEDGTYSKNQRYNYSVPESLLQNKKAVMELLMKVVTDRSKDKK